MNIHYLLHKLFNSRPCFLKRYYCNNNFFRLLVYENNEHMNVNLSIIRQFTNDLPEQSKCVCKSEIKITSVLKVNKKINKCLYKGII